MATNVLTMPGGTLGLSAFSGAIGATGYTMTVPAGKRRRLICIVSDFTASATVGNRVIQCRVTGPLGATYAYWIGAASGNVAAAAVCGYDVGFGCPGTPSTTVRRNIANSANTGVQVRELAPSLIITPGCTINIDDSANIDNADTINLFIWYEEYDI